MLPMHIVIYFIIHSVPLDSKMNIVPVDSWELVFVALQTCGAVIIIFVSYYTITVFNLHTSKHYYTPIYYHI